MDLLAGPPPCLHTALRLFQVQTKLDSLERLRSRSPFLSFSHVILHRDQGPPGGNGVTHHGLRKLGIYLPGTLRWRLLVRYTWRRIGLYPGARWYRGPGRGQFKYQGQGRSWGHSNHAASSPGAGWLAGSRIYEYLYVVLLSCPPPPFQCRYKPETSFSPERKKGLAIRSLGSRRERFFSQPPKSLRG